MTRITLPLAERFLLFLTGTYRRGGPPCRGRARRRPDARRDRPPAAPPRRRRRPSARWCRRAAGSGGNPASGAAAAPGPWRARPRRASSGRSRERPTRLRITSAGRRQQHHRPGAAQQRAIALEADGAAAEGDHRARRLRPPPSARGAPRCGRRARPASRRSPPRSCPSSRTITSSRSTHGTPSIRRERPGGGGLARCP